MQFKSHIISVLLMGCGVCCHAAVPEAAESVVIPTVGNIFVTSEESSVPGYRETDQSPINVIGQVRNWADPATVLSIYFKTSVAGKLKLWLRASAGEDADSKSTVRVATGGKSRKVNLRGGAMADYDCGTCDVRTPGYVRVDISGIKKSGPTFGAIDGIVVAGPATKGELHFTPAERADNAYWSRRGPSVHLAYRLPADSIEYFYNEVTVPEGSDVDGTYFMLTGFGEGYMGIQSAVGPGGRNDNRVLFSVWSPFTTDNPAEIPDSLHVKVLSTGSGVTARNFGNEGSGKQSFMAWPWHTGRTYKTLVRIKPDDKGNTVYTGYFCDENGEWHLLAQMERPRTHTWYTHAHSFLECFNPALSFRPRSVTFGNQWARDSEGRWHEITDAFFTCDGTGQSGLRADCNGGVTDSATFYLQNCGFVPDTTTYGTSLRRHPEGRAPHIDFEALETLAH